MPELLRTAQALLEVAPPAVLVVVIVLVGLVRGLRQHPDLGRLTHATYSKASSASLGFASMVPGS